MSSIEIHPMLVADLNEAYLVGEAAFHEHNRLLYTGPLSTASREKRVASLAVTFDDEPHVSSFKAVDFSSGRIVAMSRWAVHEADQVVERSIAEIVAARLGLDAPEMRKDVAWPLYTMIQEGKRDVLGIGRAEHGEGVTLRKRVELEVLCVHPEYQTGNCATSAAVGD
ncbi:hypothetical protein BDW62DRAFT_188075 [Aspergillus aurantiobrunneus]